MSRAAEVDKILKEKDAEKVLRGAYLLDPETLLWLLKKDEKKFDKFTIKVAKLCKSNRKIVKKIREEYSNARV